MAARWRWRYKWAKNDGCDSVPLYSMQTVDIQAIHIQSETARNLEVGIGKFMLAEVLQSYGCTWMSL